MEVFSLLLLKLEIVLFAVLKTWSPPSDYTTSVTTSQNLKYKHCSPGDHLFYLDSARASWMVSLILFVFTQLFLHTVARVVQLKCQSAHTTLMLRTLQWLLLTKAYKRPCVIWCLGVSAASSLTILTLVCAALSTLALQEEVFSCLKGSAHFSPFWDVHLSVCPLGALLT